MFKYLLKKLTNNDNNIPLLWITFNKNMYLKDKNSKSCSLKIHPSFRNNYAVIKKIEDLIDYIRNNYDLKEL
jgi:hypothetical protein